MKTGWNPGARGPGRRVILALFVAAALAPAAGCIPRPAGEAAEIDDRSADTPVAFRVHVPDDTPKDAKVCLSGNLAGLGGWRADGLVLHRAGDGTYQGSAALPRGSVLEFKATLGTWRGVEKNADGADRPNRRLVVSPGMKAEVRVESWAGGGRALIVSTLTGTIRTHDDFPSKRLGNRRRIVVYLPPGYDDAKDTRYPVLYLQDGRNVFDSGTAAFGVEWQADESAERLIRGGAVRPVILVAVDSTPTRIDEYTPQADAKRKLGGGKGDDYAAFLLDELKPFIDKTYRTRTGAADTGVVGSSLGGLLALHVAVKHPDRVGLCAALSPSLWWADEAELKAIEADRSLAARLKGSRIWFDMGSEEGSRHGEASSPEPARTRRLAASLGAAGLAEGRDFRYLEVPGGRHDERAWGARFDQVLIFLIGNPEYAPPVAPDIESPPGVRRRSVRLHRGSFAPTSSTNDATL